MGAQPLVHIVEDDPHTGQAMVRLFGSVNIEASHYLSPPEFLQGFKSDRPGCILIDIRLPGMSGLELYEQIRARGWTHSVIFVTGHGDVATAVRAMKAGAVDFLQKPFNEQLLLETVVKAIKAHEGLLQLEQRTDGVRRRFRLLSPREREVAGMVVAGKPTKQIAAELGLSHKTVDNHRASILDKMEAGGVVDLVRMILLIQPELCANKSASGGSPTDRFLTSASS